MALCFNLPPPASSPAEIALEFHFRHTKKIAKLGEIGDIAHRISLGILSESPLQAEWLVIQRVSAWEPSHPVTDLTGLVPYLELL